MKLRMAVGVLASATFYAAVCFTPALANAQALGGTDPFIVSISPQYPQPFSNATLSFISGSVDLTDATVSVLVGGREIYSGNARPVSIPLGAAGSAAHITVRTVADGATQSKSLTVVPQEVALVAEPAASAPALYEGKPLVPEGGTVRVVAMANVRAAGEAPDPAALSYAWTVDGARVASASGIGKSAIVVAAPLRYRARTVSVIVQTQDASASGGATLSFSSEEPSVRIYENDPLMGIRFDHALSGPYSIAGAETSLFAAPFSFSSAAAPVLAWFLDGRAAQTGSGITLRPAGEGAGSARVSLSASDDSGVRAQAELSLSFGSTSSANLFGL